MDNKKVDTMDVFWVSYSVVSRGNERALRVAVLVHQWALSGSWLA